MIKMNIYKTEQKQTFKTDISQLETAGLNYIVHEYIKRYKDNTAYTSSGDYAALWFIGKKPTLSDDNTGEYVKIECLTVNDSGVPFAVSESGETYVISGY